MDGVHNVAEQYTVYAHICKENGKRYIGKTRQSLQLRFLNGLGYRTQPAFWNEIKRVGWDGFEHRQIAHGLSSEEATRLEFKLIDMYRTTEQEYGYNTVSKDGYTRGGYSEAHSKRMKELCSTASWKSKHDEGVRRTAISEEYLNAMRKKNKALAKKESWQQSFRAGIIRRGMSDWVENHKKATKEKFGFPVICYTKDGVKVAEYKSYHDAAEKTGISVSGISNVCNGKQYTAGGFVWKRKTNTVRC